MRSTVTTMSITTTDVNNDLSPELFMSQITEMPDSAPKIKRVGKHICEPIIDDAARDACEQIHSIVKPMSGAIHRTAMSECLSRISQEFQTDCLALLTLFTSTFTGDDAERCDKIPANWQYLKGQCTDYHQYKSTSRYVSSDTDIPNSRRFNVLLAKDNNGEWRRP